MKRPLSPSPLSPSRLSPIPLVKRPLLTAHALRQGLAWPTGLLTAAAGLTGAGPLRWRGRAMRWRAGVVEVWLLLPPADTTPRPLAPPTLTWTASVRRGPTDGGQRVQVQRIERVRRVLVTLPGGSSLLGKRDAGQAPSPVSAGASPLASLLAAPLAAPNAAALAAPPAKAREGDAALGRSAGGRPGLAPERLRLRPRGVEGLLLRSPEQAGGQAVPVEAGPASARRPVAGRAKPTSAGASRGGPTDRAEDRQAPGRTSQERAKERTPEPSQEGPARARREAAATPGSPSRPARGATGSPPRGLQAPPVLLRAGPASLAGPGRAAGRPPVAARATTTASRTGAQAGTMSLAALSRGRPPRGSATPASAARGPAPAWPVAAGVSPAHDDPPAVRWRRPRRLLAGVRGPAQVLLRSLPPAPVAAPAARPAPPRQVGADGPTRRAPSTEQLRDARPAAPAASRLSPSATPQGPTPRRAPLPSASAVQPLSRPGADPTAPSSPASPELRAGDVLARGRAWRRRAPLAPTAPGGRPVARPGATGVAGWPTDLPLAAAPAHAPVAARRASSPASGSPGSGGLAVPDGSRPGAASAATGPLLQAGGSLLRASSGAAPVRGPAGFRPVLLTVGERAAARGRPARIPQPPTRGSRGAGSSVTWATPAARSRPVLPTWTRSSVTRHPRGLAVKLAPRLQWPTPPPARAPGPARATRGVPPGLTESAARPRLDPIAAPTSPGGHARPSARPVPAPPMRPAPGARHGPLLLLPRPAPVVAEAGPAAAPGRAPNKPSAPSAARGRPAPAAATPAPGRAPAGPATTGSLPPLGGPQDLPEHWEAPPARRGPPPQPEAAAPVPAATPAPTPPPPATLTEAQLLAVLTQLTETSPRGRRLLRAVERELSQLRRVDRMRSYR